MSKRVVVVGDSTAAGVGGAYGTVPWSNLLESQFEIINASRGGSGWQDLNSQPRFAQQILKPLLGHVDVVVVCGGTNDIGVFAGKSKGDGEEDLGATVAELKPRIDSFLATWEPDTRVLLSTVFPVGNPDHDVPYGGLTPTRTLSVAHGLIPDFNDWLRETYGERVVDLPARIRAQDQWMDERFDKFDHVHPSNESRFLIAAQLVEVLL